MSSCLIEEADIAIIDGDRAGCVLANRLSADPLVSVLILEGGEDHGLDPRVYTPARARKLLGDERIDWNFESEPEIGLRFPNRPNRDGCVFQEGRRITHPRGKAFGGSTIINSFALIKPSASEFDAWARLSNEG